MKIAIPVSAHDKHLLPALADCLLKMGGLEEHPVIIFPTPSAKEAAYAAAEKLNAQTHVLEQDFEGGAPVACSNHFAAVVYALAAMGNTEPFLWMEADMLPTAPRWPNALQNEYRMHGQPFMGNVVPTPFADNKQLVFRENDTMMMGCGIYPANMERDERIKPLIADLAKTGMRNPREPFDIYLRWAIKRIGVADTKLICDMWGTQNYRMAAGVILCDSIDHGGKVVRERSGAVPSSAVLVHGCKDGSLAGLVLGTRILFQGKEGAGKSEGMEAKGHTVTVIGLEGPGPGPQRTPSLPGPDDSGVRGPAGPPEDDEFWGDDSTPAPIPLKAPQPKPQQEYVVPVAKPLPEALKKKTAVAEPVVSPVSLITRATIEEAMGGKKIRVHDLAVKLGVEDHELIGTFGRLGYEVGKAGWVNSTIQITKP